MMHVDPKSLLHEIGAAWMGIPYPGDTNIFTPYSYDDEDITHYFSGTTWKGHDTAALRSHCSSIGGFFTPAAFRYWLAAYLLAAIQDPDALSQGIDSILSSIENEEYMNALNVSQKRAMLHVLEFVLGDNCFEEEKLAVQRLRVKAAEV